MHNSRTKNNETVTDFITNLEPNVGTPERVLSSIGGGALIAYGLKRGDTLGVLATILGGGLAFRGVSGHCHAYDAMNIDTSAETEKSYNFTGGNKGSKNKSPYSHGLLTSKIHVTKSLTINKSATELYQYWRDFENFPKFMAHLESVTKTDEKRSHWKAVAPLGMTVEWDAEITSEIENERIGWKSVEGADVPNSGVVQFRPTANRGTEVRVTLTYEPPAGQLGALVAKLFGEEPSQQVYGDLYRFKSLMETGEIITVEGQTSGRGRDYQESAAKAKAAKATA